MSSTRQHRIDRLGIIASGVCAIHCAAIPLLISFGLIGTLGSDAHYMLEWTVLVFAFIFGAGSIYNAMQSHQRIWPQLLIIGGAFTILIGLLVLNSHPIMALGGMFLLIGHGANWRLLGTSKS